MRKIDLSWFSTPHSYTYYENDYDMTLHVSSKVVGPKGVKLHMKVEDKRESSADAITFTLYEDDKCVEVMELDRYQEPIAKHLTIHDVAQEILSRHHFNLRVDEAVEASRDRIMAMLLEEDEKQYAKNEG